MKNKYIKSCKLSEAKTREIFKCFALELTATQTAVLTAVNRNTVNRIFTAIRGRIRGKRGRGAGGKTIVFGLLKRGDKVYTEIVPDAESATLQGIIRGQVDPESVIHSDGWRGYDGPVDLGYEKHFRVNHAQNEVSKGDGTHINGIESFWGVAKHRLTKFNGIPRDLFEVYLK